MASEAEPTWKAVVARKRSQQKDLLAPWLDLAATKEVALITEISDADVLVKELAQGVHSAVDVTKAYIRQYMILPMRQIRGLLLTNYQGYLCT